MHVVKTYKENSQKLYTWDDQKDKAQWKVG